MTDWCIFSGRCHSDGMCLVILNIFVISTQSFKLETKLSGAIWIVWWITLVVFVSISKKGWHRTGCFCCPTFPDSFPFSLVNAPIPPSIFLPAHSHFLLPPPLALPINLHPFIPSQLFLTSPVQFWISPPNYSSAPLYPWNFRTIPLFLHPFSISFTFTFFPITSTIVSSDCFYNIPVKWKVCVISSSSCLFLLLNHFSICLLLLFIVFFFLRIISPLSQPLHHLLFLYCMSLSSLNFLWLIAAV